MNPPPWVVVQASHLARSPYHWLVRRAVDDNGEVHGPSAICESAGFAKELCDLLNRRDLAKRMTRPPKGRW